MSDSAPPIVASIAGSGRSISCCNLAKGANLTGIDDQTGDIVTLFNPRQQRWHDHFAYQGARIVGLTPVGRATANVLNMNEPPRHRLRNELLANRELD